MVNCLITLSCFFSTVVFGMNWSQIPTIKITNSIFGQHGINNGDPLAAQGSPKVTGEAIVNMNEKSICASITLIGQQLRDNLSHKLIEDIKRGNKEFNHTTERFFSDADLLLFKIVHSMKVLNIKRLLGNGEEQNYALFESTSSRLQELFVYKRNEARTVPLTQINLSENQSHLIKQLSSFLFVLTFELKRTLDNACAKNGCSNDAIIITDNSAWVAGTEALFKAIGSNSSWEKLEFLRENRFSLYSNEEEDDDDEEGNLLTDALIVGDVDALTWLFEHQDLPGLKNLSTKEELYELAEEHSQRSLELIEVLDRFLSPKQKDDTASAKAKLADNNDS